MVLEIEMKQEKVEQKFDAFLVIIPKEAHTLYSFIHRIYGDHSLKFLSTLATKVNGQREKILKSRDHNKYHHKWILGYTYAFRLYKLSQSA